MPGDGSSHPTPGVAVTGASGLIGKALCALLAGDGHRVVRLVRRAAAGPDEVQWDVARGIVDPRAVSGIDAVVHLAGRGIATGHWTRAVMDDIRHSRVDATRALVRSLAALPRPPRHFICASAIGFYGNRGDEVLTESSAPGAGFLADLARDWEREASAAAAFARVAIARIGVVLSSKGGMLAMVLPMFRLGLGGPVGDGRQYISWISIDDAVTALRHILVTAHIGGPVNLVAPAPVTNAEFARTLGKVLHRPAFMWVPAPAVRLAAGGMADETVLASTRARPAVLESTGYAFLHTALEPALRHVLGRGEGGGA